MPPSPNCKFFQAMRNKISAYQSESWLCMKHYKIGFPRKRWIKKICEKKLNFRKTTFHFCWKPYHKSILIVIRAFRYSRGKIFLSRNKQNYQKQCHCSEKKKEHEEPVLKNIGMIIKKQEWIKHQAVIGWKEQSVFISSGTGSK